MTFPALSNEFLLQRLQFPTKKVRMVLDTDTYNEIDDQFARVRAACPEKLNVEAVYAAPFTNDRSTGPGDGMEKSYEETAPVGTAAHGRGGICLRLHRLPEPW